MERHAVEIAYKEIRDIKFQRFNYPQTVIINSWLIYN